MDAKSYFLHQRPNRSTCERPSRGENAWGRQPAARQKPYLRAPSAWAAEPKASPTGFYYLSYRVSKSPNREKIPDRTLLTKKKKDPYNAGVNVLVYLRKVCEDNGLAKTRGQRDQQAPGALPVELHRALDHPGLIRPQRTRRASRRRW